VILRCGRAERPTTTRDAIAEQFNVGAVAFKIADFADKSAIRHKRVQNFRTKTP
jgi:hypothetical protein